MLLTSTLAQGSQLPSKVGEPYLKMPGIKTLSQKSLTKLQKFLTPSTTNATEKSIPFW
jgi:hypothetical protein